MYDNYECFDDDNYRRRCNYILVIFITNKSFYEMFYYSYYHSARIFIITARLFFP